MAKILEKILRKKETIKIGNLTPLSGPYAYYSEWEKQGIDLALEEINQSGGVNGRPVEIVRVDDQTDAVVCVEALNKLIHIDKVQAVIGPVGSDAMIAAAPFAKKNKVVLFSAIAGADWIPDADNYVFRIFPTTEQEGKSLAEAAAARGERTAAILYINNAYGLELAKAVRRFAPAAGVEIAAVEGYKTETTDFAKQLARIKEKNPQAMFLLGYPRDMGLILKQAREMEMGPDFFALDTFEDPTVRLAAGAAAAGIVYVLPGGEFLPEFVAAFKKKYGKEPNFVDAMSYDALKMLALAIARGGNNGVAIRNELLKIEDYAGASGNIAFDETGRAIDRPLAVKTAD